MRRESAADTSLSFSLFLHLFRVDSFDRARKRKKKKKKKRKMMMKKKKEKKKKKYSAD